LAPESPARCSAWLQRKGMAVTLIELVREGTSFGNAGSISPTARFPRARNADRSDGSAIRQLTTAAFVPAPARFFGLSAFRAPTGNRCGEAPVRCDRFAPVFEYMSRS
jgi:hypothetical protein